MQAITDLVTLFVTIGATYAAARVWHCYASYRLSALTPRQASPRSSPRPRALTSRAVPAPVDGADDVDVAAWWGETVMRTDGPLSRDDCGQTAFDITFEINGLCIGPRTAQHTLFKSILMTIHSSLRKRAGTVRCPEHGSAAHIRVSGPSLGALSWTAPGCCPSLRAAVEEKLGKTP